MKPSLYKESGVDIQKADRLVNWLKDKEEDDQRLNKSSVVSGIGGFAALYRPDLTGLSDPVLVSSTDGVGTKVLLALEWDSIRGLGADLVGMCVNDLYTVGGKPMFFLDYYATGALSQKQFSEVLSGIKEGLVQCGTTLLGGETAELPGLYREGHFDLAGFVVGLVDGNKILKPESVKSGDALVGLASSGFHSNGFSLIRSWVEGKDVPIELRQKLLTPTKIYSEIPELLKVCGKNIHGIAHITGGGLPGNVNRFLTPGLNAYIDRHKIPTPEWMKEFILANTDNLLDVIDVFNLGIGMVLAVDSKELDLVLESSRQLGLDSFELGTVLEQQEIGQKVIVN
ncbi:MAG: phosphoribosylformylglycinamidine cyclo-ligase [Oligoflexales bacterium]|nr:phosphoribosylformylglycinamidine cyclo-ligase [Oligoflexales bacterium]